MSSNDDASRRLGSSTADITPNAIVDDTYISTSGRLAEHRAAQRCIRRAAALLGGEPRPGKDHQTARRRHPEGGLAPWQAKRLRSYIEDKLDSTIRASDLAIIVRLSKSHFFRAFRKTFGESPLAYVMRQRMLLAQELLSTSRAPLSQVALECGMCDQAHLSRSFRRIVGTNPTKWRRLSLTHFEDALQHDAGAHREACHAEDQASRGLVGPEYTDD
jgi:AraC family transcriptional regulator